MSQSANEKGRRRTSSEGTSCNSEVVVGSLTKKAEAVGIGDRFCCKRPLGRPQLHLLIRCHLKLKSNF